ncbi:MAG: hypothetical protein Q7U98_13505 [Methylicorpusculum sp.]|uniref:hypothetical protein n=1 Tax=Methylicorpusculum sp. TaxID=2713644 RepID=UPI002728F54E|nr:hypothetical protein [Methylicorpusculum sp.]MDO8842971.1 hypothetical protein [Methylicorpusculum sp.]MDO8940163.1 hypothetical protein [Methylicorpusculum sp.]MDO9239255.1 hypothetical protein [Methylicorpusculum sp.]MDP2179510.1 hypothetical protein [Methylicorpusculum sp.]MDP2202200.1 hypothetical protein [Methylicorpusculum sp.]
MAFNLLLVFFISVLTTASAFGQGYDPTQPDTTQTQTPDNATDAEALTLSGIWRTQKSRHARINGILVKQGQILTNGAQVISIRTDSVIVEYNGARQTLHLIPHSIKKR